jgi:hypothetical protein
MDAAQIGALERQMLEEHRKDLEALARLKRFLPTNGSGAKSIDDNQMDLPGAVAEADLDEGPVVSLRGTIEQIVNSDPTVRWTTQKVLKRLQQTGFPLKAKKPIYSVGQALQKLSEGGRIRVVRRGVGSAPNIYKGKPSDQTGELEIPSEGGDAEFDLAVAE